MLPGPRLTKATVPVVRQDKARRTEALEAPGAVGTGAKEAQVGLFQAFVDVWRGRDVRWVGCSRPSTGVGGLGCWEGQMEWGGPGREGPGTDAGWGPQDSGLAGAPGGQCVCGVFPRRCLQGRGHGLEKFIFRE